MAEIRIDATKVPMMYEDRGIVWVYVDFLIVAPAADPRSGNRFSSWQGRLL